MFRKFPRSTTIAFLASGFISACQPKAGPTEIGIDAYLVENPYHEQSEANQAKSLAAVAGLLSKVAPQDDRVKVNYQPDPNRDIIVLHSIIQQNLSHEDLKKSQENYAKASFKKAICEAGEPKAVGTYGIGTETIVRDLSGIFVAKITCSSMTVETNVPQLRQ